MTSPAFSACRSMPPRRVGGDAVLQTQRIELPGVQGLGFRAWGLAFRACMGFRI